MLTKTFSDHLVAHPYARFNTFSYEWLEDSFLLVQKDNTSIPLIYTQREETGYIQYTDKVQLRDRSLSKEKAQEILNTAHYLIKIKYGGQVFMMGKGMLCSYDPTSREITPLWMALIPNKSNWELYEVSMIVSRSLRRSENRFILLLLEPYLESCEGDVIYTADVAKFIGDSIKIPVFSSLVKRKSYAVKVIGDALSQVYTKYGVEEKPEETAGNETMPSLFFPPSTDEVRQSPGIWGQLTSQAVDAGTQIHRRYMSSIDPISSGPYADSISTVTIRSRRSGSRAREEYPRREEEISPFEDTPQEAAEPAPVEQPEDLVAQMEQLKRQLDGEAGIPVEREPAGYPPANLVRPSRRPRIVPAGDQADEDDVTE